MVEDRVAHQGAKHQKFASGSTKEICTGDENHQNGSEELLHAIYDHYADKIAEASQEGRQRSELEELHNTEEKTNKSPPIILVDRQRSALEELNDTEEKTSTPPPIIHVDRGQSGSTMSSTVPLPPNFTRHSALPPQHAAPGAVAIHNNSGTSIRRSTQTGSIQSVNASSSTLPTGEVDQLIMAELVREESSSIN
jgi:hypothetical protein